MKGLVIWMLCSPCFSFCQVSAVKISPVVYFEAGVSKYYNQKPQDKGLKKDFTLDFALPHVGIAAEVDFKNRLFVVASIWEAEVNCNFQNVLKSDECSRIIKGGLTSINYTLLQLELGKYSRQKTGNIFKKDLYFNYRYAVGFGFGKLETVGINNTGGSLNLGFSSCYNGDNILLYDEFDKYLNKNVFVMSPRIGMSFVTKKNRPIINIDLFARLGFVKNFQVDWKYRKETNGVKSDYSVSAITRGTAYGIQFSYPITVYKKAN